MTEESVVPWRPVIQTVVLLVVLGAARYTTVFDSVVGRVVAGVVLAVVGVDIARYYWRRYGL